MLLCRIKCDPLDITLKMVWVVRARDTQLLWSYFSHRIEHSLKVRIHPGPIEVLRDVGLALCHAANMFELANNFEHVMWIRFLGFVFDSVELYLI